MSNNLEELRPGRELDGMAAEAMGWRRGNKARGDMPWYPPGSRYGRSGGETQPPPLSTDMTSAMKCWDWLNKQGYKVSVSTLPDGEKWINVSEPGSMEIESKAEASAARMIPARTLDEVFARVGRFWIFGDTPAHALALLAVKVRRTLKELGIDPKEEPNANGSA